MAVLQFGRATEERRQNPVPGQGGCYFRDRPLRSTRRRPINAGRTDFFDAERGQR
jgi:hypothetical protein